MTPATTPWTEDGCLAAVPANDNKPMPGTFAGRKYVMRPHEPYVVPWPPVIALSGAAGSGKSTVSELLATRFGYRKSKFAKPLKDMCRALGMTDAMIEGNQKELPVGWLGGKTPRHAMQTLGTEWGRYCMGDEFWVDLWEHDVTGGRVVVDDCRFPNEAARVRRMGGRIIRLVGRGGIAGGHVSERIDFIADEVIENDGSIAELQEKVARVVEGWRV